MPHGFQIQGTWEGANVTGTPVYPACPPLTSTVLPITDAVKGLGSNDDGTLRTRNVRLDLPDMRQAMIASQADSGEICSWDRCCVSPN
jgi:hypothetical protein